MIFPLVIASCLDSSTPIYVPWSPKVHASLYKNILSWLIAMAISGALLTAAAAVIIFGVNYAPFWTFTLCGPFAAVGMFAYGRLIGRLTWQVLRN